MANRSLETLDVGLASDLKAAFRRNGWDVSEVKQACEGNFLGGVRDVLCGLAEIRPIEHLLINLDADPVVPEGWRVTKHQGGGIIKWSDIKIGLYLNANQLSGGSIVGYELYKKLEDQAVLNANFLDFLLGHPGLIPKSWKKGGGPGRIRAIFFWGTTYSDTRDLRCVRGILWDGERWCPTYRRLAIGWDENNPAAVLLAA